MVRTRPAGLTIRARGAAILDRVPASLLDLARLQFALTAATHFLFVALTLGLATLVAGVQTAATVTGSPVLERMTRFWGQLYVVNYAVGIVTGLVMELELAMDWSGLARFAGPVFGSALAMETLVAFAVEATVLGLWIFGWGRLPRWVHLALIWVVVLTAYASAYWVLVANGFLQHPVGARVEGGVLQLTDPAAVLANPNAVVAFWHILAGGLVTAGFFVAGVSAFHLRRRSADVEVYRRSLRVGVFTTLPALVLSIVVGVVQFGVVAQTQPMKLDVFTGRSAEIARLQAAAVAAFGPGDYVPDPGWALAADVMLYGWVAMAVVSLVSVVFAGRRASVLGWRAWHAVLVAAVPLPFVAMVAGWVFRETGRQPWTVYGLLRTSDAVSPLPPAAAVASLLAFSVLFAALVTVNVGLLIRHARRGPEGAALGRPPGEEPLAPVPAITF